MNEIPVGYARLGCRVRKGTLRDPSAHVALHAVRRIGAGDAVELSSRDGAPAHGYILCGSSVGSAHIYRRREAAHSRDGRLAARRNSGGVLGFNPIADSRAGDYRRVKIRKRGGRLKKLGALRRLAAVETVGIRSLDAIPYDRDAVGAGGGDFRCIRLGRDNGGNHDVLCIGFGHSAVFGRVRPLSRDRNKGVGRDLAAVDKRGEREPVAGYGIAAERAVPHGIGDVLGAGAVGEHNRKRIGGGLTGGNRGRTVNLNAA